MVQASWQIFDTSSANTLIVVDVVSQKVIWAAGGELDGPNDGTVVRTVNGGQDWKIVTPPGGAPHMFRDVEAFDADYAIMLACDTGNDRNNHQFKTFADVPHR
jgi:hypothetical protein